MPALSVVVVVHREQAHVEQCVRSVLAGTEDVELVAVDDASPDHAGELLDELAAAEPRLRVVHLAERGGRSAGLEAATGDYVWFVDVADVLPPGAVAAVLERLDEKPDLLIVGYVRENALGARKPGPKRTAAEPGPLKPGMTRGATDLFDKVIRRDPRHQRTVARAAAARSASPSTPRRATSAAAPRASTAAAAPRNPTSSPPTTRRASRTRWSPRSCCARASRSSTAATATTARRSSPSCAPASAAAASWRAAA